MRIVISLSFSFYIYIERERKTNDNSIERERKTNDNSRWETFFKNFCWGLESTSSGKLDHLIQFFELFRMMYFSWNRNNVKFFDLADKSFDLKEKENNVKSNRTSK